MSTEIEPVGRAIAFGTEGSKPLVLEGDSDANPPPGEDCTLKYGALSPNYNRPKPLGKVTAAGFYAPSRMQEVCGFRQQHRPRQRVNRPSSHW
jgi:hypothetical protein